MGRSLLLLLGIASAVLSFGESTGTSMDVDGVTVSFSLDPIIFGIGAAVIAMIVAKGTWASWYTRIAAIIFIVGAIQFVRGIVSWIQFMGAM